MDAVEVEINQDGQTQQVDDLISTNVQEESVKREEISYSYRYFDGADQSTDK